jgi:hypothetical protein
MSVTRIIIMLALMCALAWHSSPSSAVPYSRTIEREGDTLIMSCGRWAQLYQVAAKFGLQRTALWLQMPESNSRPTDMIFLEQDIWPEIREHNSYSGSYAGAWGICTGDQI